MAADDLTAPLGQNRPSKRRFALPIGIPHLLAGVLSLRRSWLLVACAIVADDPLGGEPIAVVPANARPDPGGGAAVTPARPGGRTDRRRYDGPTAGEPPLEPEPPAGSKTVTIIDGSSGKRQQVVIPSGPDGKPSEERLTEPSRHGPLPRIGQDGVRPADALAKPAKIPPGNPDTPRIAIVVGGLGTSATNTGDALKRLPGPVTLAFMPYGSDIERQMTIARGALQRFRTGARAGAARNRQARPDLS